MGDEMSDQVPESTAPAESANPAQEPKESEVDWKAKSRDWERRAKENKSAAEELAALKDSQKTNEQRAEERVAELERRAAAAEAKALRSDIAAKHGLSAEDRDLFLTGTDESTLNAQAQRLAERVADRKKQGNFAPKEGTTPSGATDSGEREFVRNLFSRAE